MISRACGNPENGLFLLVETPKTHQLLFSGPKQPGAVYPHIPHSNLQTRVSFSGFHMNTFSYDLTYL